MIRLLSPFAALLLMITVFSQGTKSWAHVPTTDSNGNTKTWNNPSIEFYANFLNSSSLSSSEIFTSITNSLQRWKAMGTANVSFDYWHGSSTVSPVVAYDGRNVIFFTSRSSSVSLGSGVIGATYVYSSGARILETDIALNDRSFTFTRTSTDTTNGNFLSTVFIENVLTHEIGHAYGLSHSNSLQSVMMWQEAQGQAKPSCDDINGMASIYPNTSYTSSLGSISGTVRSSNGSTAVFGAYVHAISKTRGVSVATAITNTSGAFTIQNLEPGQYSIMVEPFTNITNSLCGGTAAGCYWGTANASTVCSGSSFSRFFIEASPGYAALVSVSAASNASLGNINVSCSAMTQRVSNTASAQFPGSTPTILSNIASSSSGATAVYGVFSGAAGVDKHYYKLDTVEGTIKAKALAFSLYSKVDVDVDIVDATDTPVSSAQTADVFPSVIPGVAPYPYINYDSNSTYTSAPSGTYYIRVKYNALLGSTKFPGPAARDSTLFYLLILTVNDSTSLNALLDDNARCEKTDSFSAYSDRGTPVALDSAASSSSSGSGGGSVSSAIKGACGTIVSRDGQRGRPGSDALFSAWGLLVILLMSRLAFKWAHR